jgi:hypothetical protein
VGDFHLPVGVVGCLRLVEGDDGVDQGEAVPARRPVLLAARFPVIWPALGMSSPEAAASARPAGVQYQ